MSIIDLLPFLPALTLVLMAVSFLMVGVFAGDGATGKINGFASVSMLLIAVMAGFMATVLSGDRLAYTSLGAFIQFDGFSGIVQTLLLLTGAVALFMATGFLKKQSIAKPEYAVLLMLSVAGMMVMVSSNNFLTLYLGLELQSLPLYVLAAFNHGERKSTEAGLKYFMLGALASCFLLFGISLVYGFSGTTNYADVASFLAKGSNIGLYTGALMILGALAFKLAAAPFHMWAPDVYEGAPTPVTAFFAIVAKIAAFGIVIRVLTGPFAALFHDVQPLIIGLAVISLVIGSFGGLGQTNLKRLLAYSSIGHVGFGLMGLAAGTPDGVAAVLIYLVLYAVMSLGAFALLLLLRREGKPVETMADLAGLSVRHPGLALGMALLMFSMAGIPPLVGFFGKLYIFIAAFRADLMVLVVLGALASVVSAFYYLRVVKAMYVDEPLPALDTPERGLKLCVFVAAVLNVVGVVFVSPLADLVTAQLTALTFLP